MPPENQDSQPTNAQIRAAQARAVGGKRDRCSKGKSCSAACITRADRCLVEIPLSPAQAINKVRESIEGEKSKQLQLLKAADVVSERDAKRNLARFRRENERGVVNALSVKDKDKYNDYRQRAVEYNKMLVREGLDKKSGLVNVPVSWERAVKIRESYYKARDIIKDNMKEAARIGDRTTYDREERRLMRLQKRLASKVGDRDYARRGVIWDREGGNDNYRNSFLKGLRESSVLKGSSIEKYYDTLSISKMVAGHKVSIEIEESGKGFAFKIDGSYEKPKGMPMRVSMQIANETESMFRDVVSHMRDGSVVSVYPYGADGRGDKRRRAYERFGFGSEEYDSSMYGVVSRGRIVPGTRRDMEEYVMEGDYNFAELTRVKRVKLFYTMLWGEDPTPNP